MRLGDGHQVGVLEHLDTDALGLTEQEADQRLVGHHQRGVDALPGVDDIGRQQTLRMEPVHVRHEEILQFGRREPGLRIDRKVVGHERHGLLELVHGAWGHGVETTGLTTHGDRRDHEDGDRCDDDENREHRGRLVPHGRVPSYTVDVSEPRPRSRVATEQALIAAGRRLIADRPFESISNRDVAELAGCNHGLITLYFGTKTGLFTKVLHEVIGEIGAEVASGSTVATLAESPVMTTYWRLLASLLGAGLDPSEARASGTPVVEAIVQRSSAITGLSLDDARAFAATVILMMGGYHVFGDVYRPDMASEGDPAEAARVLQQAANFMLRGLTESRNTAP